MASLIFELIQAESLHFASGRIRNIYAQLVKTARFEFDDLFTNAYKKLYTKNKDLVDHFLDGLSVALEKNGQPKKAFDKFFETIIGKNANGKNQIEIILFN